MQRDEAGRTADEGEADRNASQADNQATQLCGALDLPTAQPMIGKPKEQPKQAHGKSLNRHKKLFVGEASLHLADGGRQHARI